MTRTVRRSIRRFLSAFALIVVSGIPGFAQSETDSIPLSLSEALALGLRANPQVESAAYARSAAGAGMWDAYGNFLPAFSFLGQTQKSGAGTFSLLGAEFQSPEQFTTVLQWDVTHRLLDSGRDWFRLRAARASVDRTVAAYDLQSLETATAIKAEYLGARKQQAFLALAEQEIDQRREQLRLAEARHELGEVTISDVLQARLNLQRAEVGKLQARQALDDAELALRRLLGGDLPEGALRLTSSFVVNDLALSADELVDRAIDNHPTLREIEAQKAVDASNLWIARSSYLPSLQFQYSVQQTVVDTNEFKFSSFDGRDIFAVTLNWSLFGGFRRFSESSQANAALQTSKAEERNRRLTIEEGVRSAYRRLETARATLESHTVSIELAAEDLRLSEERYRNGAGSFVDLVDARVRSAQAQTDLISATYDVHLALVELERATSLHLFSETGQ